MENKLNYLVDLANELDNNQAHRLADTITHQIKTASEDYDHEYDMVRNQMETAERAIDGIEDVIGEDGEGNLMALPGMVIFGFSNSIISSVNTNSSATFVNNNS